MNFGIDICKIDRLKKHLKDDRFLKRILTELEIEEYLSKGELKKLEYLAGRFSSKESFSKALGTGIGEISFKEIQILNEISGQPTMTLRGKALKLWKDRFLNGPKVSITHDGNFVVSLVMGEEKKDKLLNFSIPHPPFPLEKRNVEGHKGTFGKVGIIGGSNGMLGSVYLSSMAALRTGSGLVYSGVPGEIYDIMQIKSTENIVKEIEYDKDDSLNSFYKDLDALGIGPGIGETMSLETLKKIFKSYANPIVLDADGLNLVSKSITLIKEHKKFVMTPHPGEFSRLIGKSIESIENNRIKYSMDFAREYSVVLVLKGHNTLVTDGKRLYQNKTGTNGLGTAGSGDVLTGIITSLLGQGYNLYEGTCLGVYIHGLCGNFLEESMGSDGIIASDIFNEIPYVIKALRER
ncbi:NAD(P)H-hydrate dehydratase [Lagierella sp.]|uniref:NAD(P)H-hydrate dehydratase n=1 Tax=Lagierella sp. TaxID=2849657 RepID=UPI00261D35F4|nr:NAD(P)H-hydrate dehydratase [Lagierella sp.]